MRTKIAFGLIVVATILLFSPIMVTISQAWYNSPHPWSQNQYDAQHTGASESPSPSSNSTIWMYDTGGGDSRARHVVVGDGRVFGIRGGSFFVLDETTGVFVLSGVGGGGYGGNFGGAYANGKVYYTSYDYIYGRGTIYCYNATTGDQLWTYDTTPGQIQHPPTVSGNRVYVGTLNNYTYCIEDGVQKWYKKLGGPIYSAPAVDGDLFCIGCDDGQLYAFDISGAEPVSLWNFTVGNAIRGPITIEDDKVYFSSGGYLYIVDKTNGQLIWSWKSKSNGELEIAVAAGIVYVCTNQYQGGLYALYSNVTAGNYTYDSPEPRLWGDGTADGSYGLVIAGTTLFYVEMNSNMLRARNTLTSTHLWSFELSYSPINPIVADGHVFVADQYRVYCIGSAYPLVTNTYNLSVGGQPFTVDIQTNSTVSNIDSSNVTTTMNMSFTVESSQGTGMCNITLPNSMLGGPYFITVDGNPPLSSETIVVNETHTALYFTYNGTGKYTAQITGTTAIPEFTFLTEIALYGLLTLTVVYAHARKRLKFLRKT